MLKVNEQGILEIKLAGQPRFIQNAPQLVLMLAIALVASVALFFLIATAVALIFFGVSAVASIVYSLQHKGNDVSEGLLLVSKNSLLVKQHGKVVKTITTTGSHGKVSKQGDSAKLVLETDAKPVTVTGFDNPKEAEIALSCLQGKKITTRKRNIVMKG